MSSDWSLVNLGEYCKKIGSGATPRGGGNVYLKSGEVCLIRSQNIYNDGFRSEGLVFVSHNSAAKLDNVKVEPGDVLLNITGDSVARVCLAPKACLPARVNQHVAIIRPDPRYFDARFLRFLLSSSRMQNLLLTLAGAGATRNALTKGMLENLKVEKPPLEAQRGLGDILESFESKAELNAQINQTLEHMAQALFKSWFVDYDPVIDNAIDAGNPIPEPLAERAARRKAMLAAENEKAPARLPAETRRLFPDRFEEDEALGWVPKGWKSKAVSQVLHINPKVKLPKNTVAKYADMKSIPTSGYMVDGVIEKPYSGGAKFESGDVLLARITPCLENGKTALVDFLEEDEVGFGSTEFVVMRGKGELGTPYVACLARWDEFRSYCIQNMVGSSGRQRIHNSSFDSFYVALPENSELLTFFDQKCEASFRIMTEHRKQTEALTKLRDTLLPKLLSGELQLPEAEAAVETALEVEPA